METLISNGNSDVTIPQTGVNAFPNMVNDPNAKADSAGHKIIPAGTPLGGTSDALNVRGNQVVTLQPVSNASQAQGILRHDTDVTNGPAKSAIVNAGVIETNLMDDNVAKLYTDSFRKQLKGALPRVNVITRS